MPGVVDYGQLVAVELPELAFQVLQLGGGVEEAQGVDVVEAGPDGAFGVAGEEGGQFGEAWGVLLDAAADGTFFGVVGLEAGEGFGFLGGAHVGSLCRGFAR